MGMQRRGRTVNRASSQKRAGRSAVVLVTSSPGDAEPLVQALKQQRYDMRIATSLAGMDEVIRSGMKVALAVIDPAGFGQALWQHCEKLQAASIPFLVITDQRSPSVQQESLLCGARGVFTKPVGGRQLAEYVRATLGR